VVLACAGLQNWLVDTRNDAENDDLNLEEAFEIDGPNEIPEEEIMLNHQNDVDSGKRRLRIVLKGFKDLNNISDPMPF
jgi:hypothetical protein